jgi:diguanylate cyclase (GGDEF)-like protein
VLLLVAGLLALSAACWLPVRAGAARPDVELRIPWWLLTALFGIAEVYTIKIPFGRQAQTVSLSEIPLVLGLFFTVPADLVAARLLGPVLVFAVYRRQPPVKVVYNAALLLAEACTSLLVFSLALAGRSSLGAWSLLAVYLTCAVASGVSAIATTLAIALYDGTLRGRDLLAETVSAAPVSLMVGTAGLVATYALAADARSAWALLACGVVVVLGFRAYAALKERHHDLERLYRLSGVIGRAGDTDAVLNSVLLEARELLRAEYAEFSLPGAAPAGAPLRVAVGRADGPHSHVLPGPSRGDDVAVTVVTDGAPVLLPRGTKDAAQRACLRNRALRDAVIAPVPGEGGITGTLLIGNRMAELRTFDWRDVRLLETVANHASVALQNGRLIDRLRYEAMHDALTGLANRILLKQKLDDALGELKAGAMTRLAVMIMDLDGFKEVNDTLGHHYGDLLLREVALRVTSSAGPNGTVARLGGDEFALLLADAGGTEALAVGRSVLAALQEPIRLDGIDVAIGASIGISLAPEDTDDSAGLLKRADVAMYGAKTRSLGITLYRPGVQPTTSSRRPSLRADRPHAWIR